MARFAERLCRDRRIATAPADADCAGVATLVVDLINEGSLALGDAAD
jgi:hypothetical protein